MIHIKQILDKVINNASKAKFYRDNRNLFVRYFENEAIYIAKVEGIINNLTK